MQNSAYNTLINDRFSLRMRVYRYTRVLSSDETRSVIIIRIFIFDVTYHEDDKNLRRIQFTFSTIVMTVISFYKVMLVDLSRKLS